jgi:hypothetical protein
MEELRDDIKMHLDLDRESQVNVKYWEVHVFILFSWILSVWHRCQWYTPYDCWMSYPNYIVLNNIVGRVLSWQYFGIVFLLAKILCGMVCQEMFSSLSDTITLSSSLKWNQAWERVCIMVGEITNMLSLFLIMFVLLSILLIPVDPNLNFSSGPHGSVWLGARWGSEKRCHGPG